jgi:hypothetical protein
VDDDDNIHILLIKNHDPDIPKLKIHRTESIFYLNNNNNNNNNTV